MVVTVLASCYYNYSHKREQQCTRMYMQCDYSYEYFVFSLNLININYVAVYYNQLTPPASFFLIYAYFYTGRNVMRAFL